MKKYTQVQYKEMVLDDDTWQRARGNQRFRERRFVESGGERRRLIGLGIITPAKKKGK